MLNLKKGLALVLAAATAFTFAPVANLGNAVDAHAAAIATPSYDLQSDDFTNSSATPGAAYASYASAGFDRLYLTRELTVEGGHSYRLIDNEQNIENIKYSNTWTNAADISNWKQLTHDKSVELAAGSGDKTVYIAFDLTAPTGSFELWDMTSGSHKYDRIIFSVKNPNSLGKENATSKVAIFENKSTTGSVYKEADHRNISGQNDQYTLQLNKNASAYKIGVKKGNFTTWTGYSTTTVSDFEAQSVSGGLVWENPKANSGTLKTDLDSNSASPKAADLTDYVIGAGNDNGFHVTAADSAEKTIYVNYKVTDAAHSDKSFTRQLELKYVVDRSTHAVDWIKWSGDKQEFTQDASNDATTLTANGAPKQMDPYVHNAKRIVVKSESNNISFVSSDSKIVTVTKDSKKPYAADVKAISAGDATISIFVDSTNNNKGMVYKIPVSVSTQGEDDIQLKDSAGIYGNEAENTIYLDAADQTASGAITSDKLTFISAGGLNVKDVKVADEGVVKFDKNTNTLSAAAKLADVKTAPKTTTVTVTTATDGAKNVVGGTKTFTVVVWGKVANPYKANDVTLSLSDQSKRTQLLTTDPVNVTVSWKDVTGTQQDELNDGGNDIFEMTNATTHDNTQTSATVIAKSFGSGRVKALSVETAQYRPTARFATVTVGADNVNVITVDKDSVVLTEGETAAINAKASETGKTVEVKSADSSVATAVTGAAVTAGTPITVTAVKAGQTTLTVSSNGATDKVIPVVVVSKNAIENATPEKVTGLKVSNKKGAHVSVKWTSQGKNINYRIWKKVGKGKWVGKNVAGNKTTLSVKKGAKVQVKVKAYVKDSNGKTTWGPKATKAKTFKSDKK